MRFWIRSIKPDVVIHLGDHYDDAEEMALEFRDCRFIKVPGNCDMYRYVPMAKDILTVKLDGVTFYLTHGHRHGVKSDVSSLLAAARVEKAQAVLYGHTHRAELYKTEDGLLVMNPGACGSSGGSVGLIQVEQKRIVSARLLSRDDMDDFS